MTAHERETVMDRVQRMIKVGLSPQILLMVSKVYIPVLFPLTFAIAWTLTKDFVGSTLIGVTSEAQLDAHLAAAEAEIPADVLAECDRLSREIRYPLG